MADSEFEIYYVQSERSDDEASQMEAKLMKKAHRFMAGKGYTGLWLDEDAIIGKHFPRDDLFVFAKFEGEAFHYLKERNFRIIGPLVILYCEPSVARQPFEMVPLRMVPFMSQCMRGAFVTASNLTANIKEKISDLVFCMAGVYTPILTNSNNFLVTDSIFTRKYKVARQLKTVRIVRPEWVFDCFEKYQHAFRRHDEDSIVKKYSLPMFNGLSITVSGIDDRENIEKLVVKNGGTYAKALRLNVPNTYLLVAKPTGEKYKYARQRNIPCIRVEWLYDSIAQDIALSTSDYEIEELESGSSIINIKEEPTTNTIQIVQPAEVSKERDLISLIEDKTTEALSRSRKRFLEDCIVLIIGFDRDTAEVLKANARRFGVLTSNQFKPVVTHVIVGPRVTSEELKEFLELRFDKFVTIDWFIACLESGEVCPWNYHRYDIVKMKAIPSKAPASNVSRAVINLTPNKSNSGGSSGGSSRPPLVNSLEELAKVVDLGPPTVNPPPVVIDRAKNYTSLIASQEQQTRLRIRNKSPEPEPEPMETSKDIYDAPTQNESDESEERTELMEANDETEEDSIAGAAVRPLGSSYVFMFTGFSLDEKTGEPAMRENFIELVLELGAEVCRDSDWNVHVTHLITFKPYATEKMLSGMAAGVWILNSHFITDSANKHRFVSEEPYEWKKVTVSAAKARAQVFEPWARKHFQETGDRIFQGWVFLFLNAGSGPVRSTMTVTRAGGAEIHDLSAYRDDPKGFDRLLRRLKFAIFSTPSDVKLPKWKLKMIERIEEEERTIVTTSLVTKYLFSGPQALNAIVEQSRLNLQMIKTDNAKFN